MSGKTAKQAGKGQAPKNDTATAAMMKHLEHLMKADDDFPPPFPEEPCTEGAVILLCGRCVEGKYEYGWIESGELHEGPHGLKDKKPCGGCIEP